MKKYNFSLLDIIVYSVLTVFTFICFVPFLYTFTYSLTPYSEYLRNPINLLPRNINFEAYKQVLNFHLIRTGFLNSVFIVIIGAIIQIILLVMTAYPLTKKRFKGGKLITYLFIFTMLFNGGIIPEYYVIRNLKLINSLWALILTSLIGAYSLILMKNFFSTIPESLCEAATIDGANDFLILFRIVLPLSLPALATLLLFYSVNTWNDFFRAIVYTTKRELWPLQLVLREMIINGSITEMNNSGDPTAVFPFNLQMATVMVSIVPIICLYPFLQKYFVKGMALGAVKG